MADANELVAAMKKAATEAVEAGKPVNVFFGKVKAVKPLKIDVEQKLLLGEKQLILSRSVTDYKITITEGIRRIIITPVRQRNPVRRQSPRRMYMPSEKQKSPCTMGWLSETKYY